ncbi:type VII secretion target [Mycolicibacterium komossense]|uniref:ESX-1 secretion-associated protein n=1 Tax=Mycolicibacterium komossense TaxID=1779 RepID=A0ABT3CD29_9MYCO|nr:type VII secretion target [Mycolicibacterium komossense]MCV7227357.1 ESX-1 secretion-associated protein [Mycolicibacterium komossense]
MGERDSARLDVAAVRAAAERFDGVADDLQRVARIPLTFDGPTAGRAHGADGAALRAALDQIIGDLAVWARAAAEIATGLRAGADRYVDADLGATARIA